ASLIHPLRPGCGIWLGGRLLGGVWTGDGATPSPSPPPGDVPDGVANGATGNPEPRPSGTNGEAGAPPTSHVGPGVAADPVAGSACGAWPKTDARLLDTNPVRLNHPPLAGSNRYTPATAVGDTLTTFVLPVET